MLELKNITKNYYVGDEVVEALKGVDLKFRESEFVSILGPSGCGKTTLLNIIGGLDHYTDGDLIINGRSTKEYKDKDWDVYRNHSIGFVFQSYNLIPHQTVLENVELALTLSGVSKKERRERATSALVKVGLADKLKSKPNQLSGGQMQRVAIARALVNDPDILLADEPTGALDSTTSVQIMDLLSEIAKDRLIIMVTHNPSLAEEYSTRIIKILDGKITDDSMPFDEGETLFSQEKPSENTVYARESVNKKNKTSMSFWTALSLSFKNLMTKKGRTFLTSFAGSIGIIGIALILSISSGFQAYIDRVQKDTLSNYPITISERATDVESIITSAMDSANNRGEEFPDDDYITGDTSTADMLNSINNSKKVNDLASFKAYLENPETALDRTKVSAIQYIYNLDFEVYHNGTAITGASDVFGEMINNQEFIKSQYDLIGENSRWNDLNSPNEAVLVVNTYNKISDSSLLSLGFKTKATYELNKQLLMVRMGLSEDDAVAMLKNLYTDEEREKEQITFDEIIGREYTILPSSFKYKLSTAPNGNVYAEEKNPFEIMSSGILTTEGVKLKIVGIARLNEEVVGGSLNKTVVYGEAFTKLLIEKGQNSEVAQAQLANPEYNIFDETGEGVYKSTGEIAGIKQYEDVKTNLKKLGYADLSKPSSISIYPVSFEDKDYIKDYIKQYNSTVDESKQISAPDILDLMMGSVSTIINAISYVLIGFVSVSLVVSSIMIGIITYISVLERIKEIGILRAVGASKKDISRVFTAETLIIGFVSGIIGIGVTLLLTIPINLLLKALAGISNVAALPVLGAVILVVISMLLTFIAGLVPSRIASKKDPVEALRSE